MEPIPENDWQAWSPPELFTRIERFNRGGYVVGGWALDIWHGRQVRPHEDLEFCVLPDYIEYCRKKLPELEFFSVVDEGLIHLPSSEPVPVDLWQFWGADMAAGCWRVDMMLERGSREVWSCKRQPSIQLPRAAAIRINSDGISYLAPALVLLFKAKYMRQKDIDDFLYHAPNLEAQEIIDFIRWLDVTHPGHKWIASLDELLKKK